VDLARKMLHVTERLYAAVTEPEQWTPALEAISDLLGGAHAIVDIRNPQSGDAFVARARLDERDLMRVFTPDTMQLAQQLVGRVPVGISVRGDIISDADFARTVLYNEVLRPLDGFHSIHLRSNGSESLLTVCRPESAESFNGADVTVLRSLAPHMATAIALQRRLRTAEAGYASLANVLDRMDSGIILTDGAGRPILLNARAARLVQEADGLIVDDTGIVAATSAATRQLGDAITMVSRGAVVEGQRVRVERPSHRPPLLLTVLPIWRLDMIVPSAGTARAAIFITVPDRPPQIDRLALAELFHLTRRESEIAALLADGADLRAIAAKLRLSVGTVRDHLKNVFEKSGVHSQSALVALLRGLVDRDAER